MLVNFFRPIGRKAAQAALIPFGKIVLAGGGGRCAPVIKGATCNDWRRKECWCTFLGGYDVYCVHEKCLCISPQLLST